MRRLYRRLESDGIRPWLDEEDLLAGQTWEDEIVKAVTESHVVLVCLSKGSVTRAGYVQKEIKVALDLADRQPPGTIFVIPVRLEECSVPQTLRRWHWVDLFDQRGYDRLMKSLIERAKKLQLGTLPLGADDLVSGTEQLWNISGPAKGAHSTPVTALEEQEAPTLQSGAAVAPVMATEGEPGPRSERTTTGAFGARWFLLFAYVVIFGSLVVGSQYVSIWALPLVLIASVLTMTVLFAFVLQSEGTLEGRDFGDLIKEALNRLFLLRKSSQNSTVEETGSGPARGHEKTAA